MLSHSFRRKSTVRTLLLISIIYAVFLSSVAFAQAIPLTKEQIFQVATLAARDGQYEQAIEYFKKVVERDPRFTAAYNSLGLLYEGWEGGNLSEAIRYFKLATDIDPQYFECWSNLGKAYYTQGNFVKAEEAFLKALEGNPDQPDIQFAMGWVYLLGQSRAEEALVCFKKALSGIDNPTIYYGMGLANLLQGDRFKVLEAITELRKRKREDYAGKLEKLVRDNVRIASEPGTPLVTGDKLESVFNKTLESVSGGKADVKNKEGIQVRLRGPLQQN